MSTDRESHCEGRGYVRARRLRLTTIHEVVKVGFGLACAMEKWSKVVEFAHGHDEEGLLEDVTARMGHEGVMMMCSIRGACGLLMGSVVCAVDRGGQPMRWCG